MHRYSEDFLDQYKNQQPSWGPLGWITYKRTYARFIESAKRNEEWWETCRRVLEGVFNLIPNDPSVTRQEMELAYHLMYHMAWTPPGRGLWIGGTEIGYKLGSGWTNCWMINTEPHGDKPSFPFRFLFDQSMLGGGVGFNVTNEVISRMPTVRNRVDLKILCSPEHRDWDRFPENLVDQRPNTQDIIYQVEDSREGWVKSLGEVIDAHFMGRNVVLVIDVSNIRPYGSPIRGFGGTASGPLPLMELLRDVNTLLNHAVGRKLTSVEATDIYNLIGRAVVAGNVRRCLPKGTLVHTKNGLIPIENVRVGDLVQTSDGYYSVTDWVYQGEQAILTIKTQMGEFKCTPRHKIAVMDGTNSYTWKRAYELEPGDRMVFVDHVLDGEKTTLPGWTYEKPERSTTCVDIKVPELNSDMAWFFGNFHGDGYVYPNFEQDGFNAYVSIACSPDYPSIIEKVEQQMASFGVNVSRVEPSKSDSSTKVRAISKQFAWYMSQFKQANTSINVPDFIMRAPSDIRAAYLAGLYDADGSVGNRPLVAVTSVYPDYLRQIQVLYASLGVPTRLRLRRKKSGNWKNLYQLVVVGEKAVKNFEQRVSKFSLKYRNKNKILRSQNDYGFPREFILRENITDKRKWTQQSKQMTVSTLERVANRVCDLIPVEVIDVVYNEEIVETYDISVGSAHEFVAEGYLVHNTAEIAIGDYDDHDFVTMKQDQEKLYHHRWASNNSVVISPWMDDFSAIAESIQYNGEPGVLNLDVARNYGRIIDGFQEGVDGRIVGSNPCGEIFLESGEPCNLAEVFPYRCLKLGVDVKDALRIAMRYAKRVTFANYHWPISQEVISRNRRVGVSLTGIQDWILAKFGNPIVDYHVERVQGTDLRIPEFNPQIAVELDNMYQAVREADYEISRELGCNPSIKVTTVKPSGTVSLLGGVAPGVHWHYSDYYIRRIRFQEQDPLLKILEVAGYKIEEDAYSPNTKVVEFPVKAPTAGQRGFKSADNVTIEDQFAMLAFMQTHWADNSVSITITFDPETEGHKIAPLLYYYKNVIKSATCLPYSGHNYEQAPYEPISEEDYHKARSLLLGDPQDFADEVQNGNTSEDLIDDAECVNGVCPIR